MMMMMMIISDESLQLSLCDFSGDSYNIVSEADVIKTKGLVLRNPETAKRQVFAE